MADHGLICWALPIDWRNDMRNLRTMILAGSVALAASVTSALAGNVDTVQKFYDLLNNPGSTSHQNAAAATFADGWESVGNYSGKNKNAEMFLGQMGGFAKLMPDLKWDVQAMHEAGDFITVRSRATGTPVAPFFGVDGEGRSFDILTIDIHEFKEGKIVRSYHVEDWASALQQLSGK